MRSVESITYVGYQPGPIQAIGSMQCTTVPPISTTVPVYTKPIVVMTSRANIRYGESMAQ